VPVRRTGGVRSTRSRATIVGLAVVALSLAGCAGVHHSSAPFVKNDSVEAGGWPVLESSPAGLTLRFISGTSFGVGIIVRNRSRERVTIVDARALEPPQSLIHQVGTHLQEWNPPPCSGRHSCPGIGFLRRPFSAARPAPVTLGAGTATGVQLNFRLGGCNEVPLASASSTQEVEVSYRYGSGTLRQETLPLGSARLRLRMPTTKDCLLRPHSHISLDGPFATSSDWTIPGSSGDTCTRAAGALVFRSRLFQRPNKPMIRVAIQFPRFKGLGLYRTLTGPAPTRSPAQVLVTAGIGIHGWTTFRSQTSVVDAARATRTTLRGRFHATVIGPHRQPFRVYGAWRCTTN
jgi:hypothetical protein